jgi:leader peptidase (prepilin peptidase)/N-methyltransferase
MTELGDLLAASPAWLAGCVFIVSLLIGSFLNVVIYRLPIMLEREWQKQAREVLVSTDSAVSEPHDLETLQADNPAQADGPAPSDATALASTSEPYNLVVPRSRCPSCNAEIRALHNIPVVSYLMLGGKCAACGARISLRYPVVEFVTAVLSAIVAVRFGWHWQTLAALVFTWALIALTVIDLDHTLLPDAITLPLLWLGLLASLGWHVGLAAPAPTDPRSAILGAAAGYLLLWLVYWAFKLLTGKEGMGYGDFKLFGALGAWLGWQMLPLVLLLSAFTGAVVGIVLIVVRGRDRNVPIPFGPYLAAAGWIALVWGPQIVGRYLAFSGLAR